MSLSRWSHLTDCSLTLTLTRPISPPRNSHAAYGYFLPHARVLSKLCVSDSAHNDVLQYACSLCFYPQARPSEQGGVVTQLEHQTVTPLTQVRFPDAASDFSPIVTFHCRLSYVCPYTLVCKRMH